MISSWVLRRLYLRSFYCFSNIYAVVKAQPKKPVPRYVDTVKGTTHDLIPSGLESIYIHSKKFGKTPNYVLNFMKRRVLDEQEKQDDELTSAQPACRYITHEERDKLLQVS